MNLERLFYMEYQLQLKPFQPTDGFKYKILQITDIALHSTIKQPTKAIGKKVKQSFEQNKPGRFYGFKIQELLQNESIYSILNSYFRQNPDFLKMIQEEEKNGYKILLSLPSKEIPIKLGDDTINFIESKNGQRIVRKN